MGRLCVRGSGLRHRVLKPITGSANGVEITARLAVPTRWSHRSRWARTKRPVMKARRLLSALALTVLAAGCTTLPVQNQPLIAHSELSGYRFDNIAPGPKNSDSLLVVLTFSGGGTRAAAFAYGVLEKLRDTEIVWDGQRRRLLDEVDVISSVSGGSFPAAYYGLFGDGIFDEFPEKALSASKVDKGFNLTLIEAPDQYIFTKAQNKSGMMVVDNLQLYADLKKNPLRGEKQANHILNILKKGLK